MLDYADIKANGFLDFGDRLRDKECELIREFE
jgi:hypothetical protein